MICGTLMLTNQRRCSYSTIASPEAFGRPLYTDLNPEIHIPRRRCIMPSIPIQNWVHGTTKKKNKKTTAIHASLASKRGVNPFLQQALTNKTSPIVAINRWYVS